MPRYIAYRHNIDQARKGDYFEESFIFTGLSLAGKQAKAQIREEPGGPVVLEFSTSNGRISISGGDTLTLSCSAVDFILSAGCYHYDIQVFTSAADVATLIEGQFTVIDQITV